MPEQVYKIIETGERVGVRAGINDDPLSEVFSPSLQRMAACKRVIGKSYTSGFDEKFEGATPKHYGFGKRGYTGTRQDLIRDSGTPVEGPALKRENEAAVAMCQKTAGALGIDAKSQKFTDKSRPMTAYERQERQGKIIV